MQSRTACRLHMLTWILSFVALGTAVRQPPMITKFSTKGYMIADGKFTLPCDASGSNLTWTWKHNGTKITRFYGFPYSLSQLGTLSGENLKAEHSGTYQCIVNDTITGIEVFSRKIQVAVRVIGDFVNKEEVVRRVNLGQSFSYQCPDHKPSFGAVYSWESRLGDGPVQLSRNQHLGISPNGGLYIMYVTQDDIDAMRERNGIKCRISGANRYYESGTLKIEKRDEYQTDPQILSSPSWAVTPNEQELAIEGRTKTLYCLAVGRPAPSITWKKNGQLIVDQQDSFVIPTSFHERRLDINNVTRAKHEDQYTCEALNALSNGNPLIHTINLEVEVAPKWTGKPPPKKMIIVFGTNGTLDCHVTAFPLAPATWYKDGVRLRSDKHLIIHGDKLELRNVTLSHDGVYQCAVENEHGMIASATWVHIRAWKPSFTDVQFGPFHLLHDSEGRLQCKPSAAPPPSFQWLRNGVAISNGDNSRYELQQDGTLVIKKADKVLDAANFTCKATNFLGEDSATTRAIVFVRPSFVTKPTNQVVLEREIVTFRCTASGIPTPNITWLSDGKTLSIGETLSFRTGRHNSGQYLCEADNGLGLIIRAEADLDVQFHPSFTIKPRDQTVKEFETVTFRCAATGNPVPQITWIKNGVTVSTANNLTFTASRNDSGKYWCLIRSGLGVFIEESATLDVQYKPENTQLEVDTAVTSAVPFGSKITFTCTSNSHPKIMEYRFYLHQERLGYSTTGVFRHEIRKSGSYSCVPFNNAGEGEKATVVIDVDGSPAPPSKLHVTDIDCIEGTLNLSWIPGASNGAPIDYYLIEEESSSDPVVFTFVFNVTDPHATEAALKLSGMSVPRLRMKAVNKFGTSPPSLLTAGEVCSNTRATEAVLQGLRTAPVYSQAWFLAVIVLGGYILLFLVAIILVRKYRQGRGHKYNVKLREKKYGTTKQQEKQEKKETQDEETQDQEKQDDADEGRKPFLGNNNPRKKPPDHKMRPVSDFSLMEENLFGEDVAFADEYKETDVVFKYEKEGTFV